MADLRTALEEAMAQVEPKEEHEEEIHEEPVSEEVVPEAKEVEQPRNEKGQFTAKENEEVVEDAPEIAEVEEPATPRPTTWKKEYLPLWDKLDKGEPLSNEEAKKFLAYTNQRESEYKKGVSAYKAEADNAKSLREAIEPFLPELQANQIHPAAWINNLGRAHMILTKAPMEQKVQLFQKLAQDYGVDLNLGNSGENTTQYLDPQALAIKQQIDQLNQQVRQVTSWREQEENSRLQTEISRFSADKPYFEELRETMAQLLESGQAQDLATAYDKAMWLVPEVREQEIKRLTQTQNQVNQVKKAKAAAVSPKSVTPSGQVNTGEKKDRRSLLDEQLSQASSRV